MRKPDNLDHIRSFKAGFRHGRDCGIVSPREAGDELRKLGFTPIDGSMIDVFCNGADDGARGDTFRYLASCMYI